MNSELQIKLFQKYPKIFAQRGLPMTETVICWGIECGDGWFVILDTLCREIQHCCDDNDWNEGFQVEAVRVRGEYGTLRFYISGGNDYIWGLISMAEAMSGKTCEICGSTVNITTMSSGWFSTRCDICRSGGL